MVNIAKFGTKAMSGVNCESLIKYAKTPKQFSEALGKDLLKAKLHEAPKLDTFIGALDAKKVSEPLTEISPKLAKKLAKKPPLWKLVIGKIFG